MQTLAFIEILRFIEPKKINKPLVKREANVCLMSELKIYGIFYSWNAECNELLSEDIHFLLRNISHVVRSRVRLNDFILNRISDNIFP